MTAPPGHGRRSTRSAASPTRRHARPSRPGWHARSRCPRAPGSAIGDRRQPIEVLAVTDIGDQTRPRPALRDRQIGHRRLDDGVAAAAAQLGPIWCITLRRGGNLSKISVTSSPSLAKRAAAARAEEDQVRFLRAANDRERPSRRLAPFARALIRGTPRYRRCACRFVSSKSSSINSSRAIERQRSKGGPREYSYEGSLTCTGKGGSATSQVTVYVRPNFRSLE